MDTTRLTPGDLLSVSDPATEAEAGVCYVTKVARDGQVNVIEGVGGAPVVDLTGALLDVNPPDSWTAYSLFQAAELIMANYLWPHIWAWDIHEIPAPSTTQLWSEVPATVRAIEQAWQQIPADRLMRIRVILERNNPVTPTRTLVRYPAIYDTYPIKLKTRRVFTADDLVGDDAVPGLAGLVGMGTAALALDPSVVARALDAEAGEQPSNLSAYLWSSFRRQRQAWYEGISDEMDDRVMVGSIYDE